MTNLIKDAIRVVRYFGFRKERSVQNNVANGKTYYHPSHPHSFVHIFDDGRWEHEKFNSATRGTSDDVRRLEKSIQRYH